MKLGEICYALQVGFLGHIRSNVRAITIKILNDRIFAKVYIAGEPLQIDHDLIKSALSEAEALMTEINDFEYEIIYSNLPQDKLEILDFWFFLRFE